MSQTAPLEAEREIIVLHRADTVATALKELKAGQQVAAKQSGIASELILNEDIALCHKVAIKAHAVGDEIYKYGQVIGVASKPIQPGDHVHVHNLRSRRGREPLT